MLLLFFIIKKRIMARESSSPSDLNDLRQMNCSRCYTGKRCIRFASNCKWSDGYAELSDHACDVDFVFVPRKYGGIFRTNSERLCKKRKNCEPIRDWIIEKKIDHDAEGYRYKEPVPICSKDTCDTDGQPTDFPYMYAFESQSSSLTKLSSNHRLKTPATTFIVKIGVPAHYTLAIIDLTEFYQIDRLPITIEYFDSGGTYTNIKGFEEGHILGRWRLRENCALGGIEKPEKSDYLLAGICRFLMKRLTESLVPDVTNISFRPVNLLDLQLLRRNIYCQTWVLLYVYFRFVLNYELPSMVKDIQNKFDSHRLGYDAEYRDKMVAHILFELIGLFQEYLVNYPSSKDQVVRTVPMRDGATSLEAFKRRVCHINGNMQILISDFNKCGVPREANFNHLNEIDKLIKSYQNQTHSTLSGHFLADIREEEKKERSWGECLEYGKEEAEEDEKLVTKKKRQVKQTNVSDKDAFEINWRTNRVKRFLSRQEQDRRKLVDEWRRGRSERIDIS